MLTYKQVGRNVLTFLTVVREAKFHFSTIMINILVKTFNIDFRTRFSSLDLV